MSTNWEPYRDPVKGTIDLIAAWVDLQTGPSGGSASGYHNAKNFLARVMAYQPCRSQQVAALALAAADDVYRGIRS
jgi:hypothetical protein